MNIRIKDVVLTLEPGGDDDGSFTSSAPVTLCVDSFSFDEIENQVNVACKQDDVATNRFDQSDWSMEIESKIAATDSTPTTGLIAKLKANRLFQVKVDLGDGVVTLTGNKKNLTIGGGDVPTWKLSLAAYGTAPTLGAS